MSNSAGAVCFVATNSQNIFLNVILPPEVNTIMLIEYHAKTMAN